MNKSELIKKISDKHDSTSVKEVEQVVSIVFDEISESLTFGERVEIRGVGSFSLRKRKAREARNPRTNQIVKLLDRCSIYFRASKNLNSKIND